MKSEIRFSWARHCELGTTLHCANNGVCVCVCVWNVVEVADPHFLGFLGFFL